MDGADALNEENDSSAVDKRICRELAALAAIRGTLVGVSLAVLW